MIIRLLCILLFAISVEAATPIILQVDATDALRRIFHAQLQIPVQSGPLTLYYPKWIPGDHSPSGPVINLTGMHFQSNGKELSWRRDPVDMNSFHLTVPECTNTVEAKLDLVIPADSEDWTYSTDSRLALGFWSVLLYPSGVTSDNVTFQTS